MKRRSLLLVVGLTCLLFGLTSFYMSSPKDEVVENMIRTESSVVDKKPPVTGIVKVPNKPVKQNSFGVDLDDDSYSELPAHIRKVIEFDKSHPMSKRIAGMIENSKKSAADRVKHLEEMGQGETFEYIHTYVKEHNAYYNADVMGRDP